jgi:cytochrome P450
MILQIILALMLVVLAYLYLQKTKPTTTTTTTIATASKEEKRPKKAESSSSSSSSSSSLKSLDEMPTIVNLDEKRWGSENHHYLDELFREHGDVIMIKRAKELGGDQVWLRDPNAFKTMALRGRVWGKRDWVVEGRLANVSNLIQPMYQFTFFEMDGAPWKTRRRVMNPLFAVRHEFVWAFLKEAATVVKGWGPGTIDLTEKMHELLQKMVFRMCAGNEFEMSESQLEWHARIVDYFVERYMDSSVSYSVNDKDREVFGMAKQVAMEAIADIRPRVAGGQDASRFGLVGVMIGSTAPTFDDEEIAETFANFVVAGAESPAMSTARTIVHMAQHPDIMRRVVDEIEANVPATLDIDELHSDVAWLNKLPYTTACLDEGLRMFAPATIVSRQALQDTELAGYAMPKDTVVGGCLYSLHYDERHWPEPRRFVPERHMKGAEQAQTMAAESKGSYVPFSLGSKKCPGGPITRAIGKVVLVYMLRHFNVSAAEREVEGQRVQKFVIWFSQGTPIVLENR